MSSFSGSSKILSTRSLTKVVLQYPAHSLYPPRSHSSAHLRAPQPTPSAHRLHTPFTRHQTTLPYTNASFQTLFLFPLLLSVFCPTSHPSSSSCSPPLQNIYLFNHAFFAHPFANISSVCDQSLCQRQDDSTRFGVQPSTIHIGVIYIPPPHPKSRAEHIRTGT
jgi:hypothetical protein